MFPSEIVLSFLSFLPGRMASFLVCFFEFFFSFADRLSQL